MALPEPEADTGWEAFLSNAVRYGTPDPDPALALWRAEMQAERLEALVGRIRPAFAGCPVIPQREDRQAG